MSGWETNIENLLPARKGIHGETVAGLGAGATSAVAAARRRGREAMMEDEASLMRRLGDGSSPSTEAASSSTQATEAELADWIGHLRELQRTYPAGHPSIRERLRQCFERLWERCKNSEAFLDVCIQLASLERDPGELLAFMLQNSVCTGHAKFHLAVASTTERRGDTASAELHYDEAVRLARAEPERNLMRRQREHFFRRRAKLAAGGGGIGFEGPQTSRALYGPHRTSPSSGPGLGPAPRSRGHSPLLRRTEQFPPAPQQQPAIRRPAFAVFSETSEQEDHDVAPSAAAPVWRRPPSAPRENVGPTQQWAGTKLDNAKSARRRGGPSSFAVYADPSNVGGDVATRGAPAEDLTAAAVRGLLGNLALNSPFEPPSKREAVAPVVEHTFATREALSDMLAIFASPSMTEGRDNEATARPPMTAAATGHTLPLAPPRTVVGTATRGSLATRFARSEFETPAPAQMVTARAATTRVPVQPQPQTSRDGDDDDNAGENVSPNVVPTSDHRDGTTVPAHPITAPRLGRGGGGREHPTTATAHHQRPALRVLSHVEEDVSPSFRAESSRPPTASGERFDVFVDDAATATRPHLLMHADNNLDFGDLNRADATFQPRGGLFDFDPSSAE